MVADGEVKLPDTVEPVTVRDKPVGDWVGVVAEHCAFALKNDNPSTRTRIIFWAKQ
jgi:hypothetical protein